MNTESQFNTPHTIRKMTALWERKLNQNAMRSSGLALIAISLAACGSGSNEAQDDGGGQTPTTPVNVLTGVDYMGELLEGDGTTIVEFKGNSDPDADTGEWTDVAVILVRDANGNITISDIQATDNDAASGNAGTTFMVTDYAQNEDGVLSFEFDSHATDEADTSVSLVLNEAGGAIGFSGGSIETLNVEIASGAGAYASDLRALSAENLQTLNITGGTVDEVFRVQAPLNTEITLLDASAALSDLQLDVSPTPSLDFLAAFGSEFEFTGAVPSGPSSILMSFDGLDPNGPAFATLDYNTASRTILLDIDGFDPIELEVPAALDDAWLNFPSLLTQPNSTVTVDGDTLGLDVIVTTATGGEVAVLSALLATPDTVQTSSTYLLGTGDDILVMGDSFGDGDKVDGGDGADLVSMTFETSQIRMGTLENVEALNLLFRENTTLDGSNFTGLTEINLAVDRNGDPTGSLSDIDLNNLKAEVDEINIHGFTGDIELDYENGADASVTVSFVNPLPAVIGDDTGGRDFEILNVRDLVLQNLGDRAMLVRDDFDLHNDTETLMITTSQFRGHFYIDGHTSGFTGTAALTDLTAYALNGHIAIGSSVAIDSFVADARSLQNYTITVEDSAAAFGDVGDVIDASELETITLTTLDEGYLVQGDIHAEGANISSVMIAATDRNVIGPYNISVQGLYADQIDYLLVDADDGGNVLLDNQEYETGIMIYEGSGDIRFLAGDHSASVDFVQTQAVDASAHSGLREFFDSSANDVFYGSDQDDDISFLFGGRDVYLDAGGSDGVRTVSGASTLTVYDDGTTLLNDSFMATDDVYLLNGTTGSHAAPDAVFYAGGGNDVLSIAVPLNFLVDFSDYDSGVLEINQFHFAFHTLSFDGMATANGIFTGTTTAVIPAAVTTPGLNSNSIYIIDDGDTVTGGPLAGQSIADYEQFNDVAAFLNSATQGDGGAGDEVIFIVHNTTTSAASGDDHDAYIYVYSDNGSGGGIQADEISLISTIDFSPIGGPAITPFTII